MNSIILTVIIRVIIWMKLYLACLLNSTSDGNGSIVGIGISRLRYFRLCYDQRSQEKDERDGLAESHDLQEYRNVFMCMSRMMMIRLSSRFFSRRLWDVGQLWSSTQSDFISKADCYFYLFLFLKLQPVSYGLGWAWDLPMSVEADEIL